jgi:hypothetical protein
MVVMTDDFFFLSHYWYEYLSFFFFVFGSCEVQVRRPDGEVEVTVQTG